MNHLFKAFILSLFLLAQAHSETTTRARYLGALSIFESPTPTIQLAWEIESSSFRHLQIQRLQVQENASYLNLGYVHADVRQFTDTQQLTAGASYYYRIRTCAHISRAGYCVEPGRFRWSRKIELREKEPFAPGALMGIVEYGANQNLSVRLNWNDYNSLTYTSFRNGNATNERGYVIERRLAADPTSSFVRLTPDPLPADSTSFVDDSVEPNKEYIYRVGALNRMGIAIFPEDAYQYKQSVAEFNLSKDYLCERLRNGQSLPANVVNFDSYRVRNGRVLSIYDASIAAANDFSNRLDQRRILLYPPGTYRINRYIDSADPDPASHIRFRNSSQFRIVGCNAKIEVKGSFARLHETEKTGVVTVFHGLRIEETRVTRSNTTLQPFRFENVQDLSVEGLELYGEADKVTASGDMPEAPGMGIFTKNCRNCTFKDLFIHHFIGDGIYLGQGSIISGGDPVLRIADRNIRIHNVRAFHNRRQGMTIVQARHVWVSNSRFNFTGDTGSATHRGHAPMAGIDVEPNFFTRNNTEPNLTEHEVYSFPATKVDITTGDILIEGSEMNANYGPSLASSLGRKVGHFPDGAVIGALWPVARIENMKLRFSNFVAPTSIPNDLPVDTKPGTLGLSVKDASLENSFVDVGSGEINVSSHTGTATAANLSDALINVRVMNNEIHSKGIAINGANGRHPLRITGNIIVATHQNFPNLSADGQAGSLRILNFIRIFRNQVVKRDTSLPFSLPLGPNSATGVLENRRLLLDPMGVKEFNDNTVVFSSATHQPAGPLAQKIATMAFTHSSRNHFLVAPLSYRSGAHFYLEGLNHSQGNHFQNCSIRPSADFSACREEGYFSP